MEQNIFEILFWKHSKKEVVTSSNYLKEGFLLDVVVKS